MAAVVDKEPYATAVAVDEPSAPTAQFQRIGATYYRSPTSHMQAVVGRNLLGVLSTSKKLGQFTVPERVRAGCLLGDVKMDLTNADFIHPITTIEAVGILGSFKLTVPRGVRVEVGAAAILGDVKTSGQSQHDQNSPLIVVRGGTLLSDIKVIVNEECPPLQIVA